jgi:hypothetical protein
MRNHHRSPHMATVSVRSLWSHHRDGLTAIRGSMICSLVIVILDVVLDGSLVFAAVVCPIWLIIAVVWVLVSRPSSGVAAARVLIPLLTGLLVVSNYSMQNRVAMANAERLIQACENFRDVNGTYPARLDDLVPAYLSSIPRARCCCLFSEFQYHASPMHMLLWCELPPFGRRTYNFDTRRWGYLD